MAKAKSVEELVDHALKLAVTNPKAAWLGKSNKALFNEKDENHKAAIAECTKPDAPLLKQVGKFGALTTAGFERIAAQLTAEEVSSLAKATAAAMPVVDRVVFLQGVIGRTSGAAAELTPLLEEAVAAKNSELEAQATAKAKQALAAAANRAALKRALELSERDFQNEVNALKRQWEALGQKLSELPAHQPATEPEQHAPKKPETTTGATNPKTAEEEDFRRNVADQLAASWRAAWDAKKDEPRDYLESAMWNVSGLELIGNVGEVVPYSGRYHESVKGVASGDRVRIVRPGWVLKEDGDDYVVSQAVIEKFGEAHG